MKEKRQAVVATAALEAFTNDMLLRRRDIHKLVQKDKTPQQKQKEAEAAAASEVAHKKYKQAAPINNKMPMDIELGIRDTITLATTIGQPVTNKNLEQPPKKHEKAKAKKKETKKDVKFKKQEKIILK